MERGHGHTRFLHLCLQAEALGITIIHVRTTWGAYERNMREAVEGLKTKGVEGGVFGDVDITESME